MVYRNPRLCANRRDDFQVLLNNRLGGAVSAAIGWSHYKSAMIVHCCSSQRRPSVCNEQTALKFRG